MSTADPIDELTEQIAAADGDASELAAIFAELHASLGPAEAGRRWWAAFGATDASPT